MLPITAPFVLHKVKNNVLPHEERSEESALGHDPRHIRDEYQNAFRMTGRRVVWCVASKSQQIILTELPSLTLYFPKTGTLLFLHHPLLFRC